NTTSFTYSNTDATISGAITSTDVLTITVHDPALTGGQQSINYTVQSGDTLADIATGLAAAITADSGLQAIGVSATSDSAIVAIRSNSFNTTTYSQSSSGSETITLATETYGYLMKINGPLAGTEDTTTFTYDGYGRLYTTTDSEGYTRLLSYDTMNRLTQ